MNTLYIGHCHPGPFGNQGLRFHLYGFIGVTWIDVPFATVGNALVYATEHGWTATVEGVQS